MADLTDEDLIAVRRDVHRRAEPAWREFHTTSRIVDAVERIGVDRLAVGPEAYPASECRGVPSEDELATWRERAASAGARADVLDLTAGGETGAVAVLERGDGPVVGYRADIDALFQAESTAPNHEPAAEGFASAHPDVMHACGHDAHVAVALGVLAAVKASEFSGTLKVFFQPAEEPGHGARAMAASRHLDDVDHLLGIHVGLDHPHGTVVAGATEILAKARFEATFSGRPAHAGKAPNEGRDAVQALAAAVRSLSAIPRHADGMTRINVGTVAGGTEHNVVPAEAHLEGEVRGETTDLVEWMRSQVRDRLEAAAAMHGCDVRYETVTDAPRADSDPELAETVYAAARATDGVDTPRERGAFGASDDYSHLMRAVQTAGGTATYAIVGTDHPTGHHTATFDVDEETIPLAVDLVCDAIGRLDQSGRADER
ncbi:amidohydrolase [Halosimplex sp. TS25]|uniref:amidohydrolase n=1 Tax=Halosimplex rarum TaxID=3396619 RepID=UPI0039E99E49